MRWLAAALLLACTETPTERRATLEGTMAACRETCRPYRAIINPNPMSAIHGSSECTCMDLPEREP